MKLALTGKRHEVIDVAGDHDAVFLECTLEDLGIAIAKQGPISDVARIDPVFLGQGNGDHR